MRPADPWLRQLPTSASSRRPSKNSGVSTKPWGAAFVPPLQRHHLRCSVAQRPLVSRRAVTPAHMGRMVGMPGIAMPRPAPGMAMLGIPMEGMEGIPGSASERVQNLQYSVVGG